MNGADPGVSLRASTLPAALAQLADALGARFPDIAALPADAAEALETLTLPAGWRPRRVLLDEEWWREPAVPMLARVMERRRVPRDDASAAATPAREAGTGWVALIPARGGYTMRALDADRGRFIEWRVDRRLAQRLAPFAFVFHRRFAPRPVHAADLAKATWSEAASDLVTLVGAALAAAALGLLVPIATRWLVDRAIPDQAPGAVGAILAALAIAGLALVVLDIVRAVATLRLEARVAVALQAAIVDRIVSAPTRFFRAFSTGDLALRIGAVNTLQRALAGALLGAFVTLAFVVANLVLMLHYSFSLTSAAAAIVAIAIVVSWRVGLARMRLGGTIEALDGRLAAATFELFGGIAKLRAAAAEGRAFARWSRRYAQFREASLASARLSNWETVLWSLAPALATVLVLAAAWRVVPSGRVTAGTFVAFHTALFALLGGVQALVAIALALLDLRPVWERARPILEAVPEDAMGAGERHDPQGAIALEHVSFAYPGGPEVLHAVDLRVDPGEFVAIVGPSGSGKSTLLRLLLGFEHPTRGTVRYDGRDLAALDVRHLRRRIGSVLQDGKLWAGDLYTNIAGATGASVEAVWEAARRAGVAADIEAMPMGLYTVVGEGLSTLSGGQRQRVLVARALVAAPRLVFLDEATSALDNVAQAAVLEGLERLEATRIVIAHRLSTVRNADRVVVVESGRIVQQGRFTELARQAGPFAALLARQVA